MKFDLEVVVLLEQIHVLSHDLLVRLLEGLVAFGQLVGHVVKRLLKVAAALREVCIDISSLVLALLPLLFVDGDPVLEHAHNLLLECLVVLNIGEHVVDVVLEFLLLFVLLNNLLAQSLVLQDETGHFELQILNNQL